MQFRALGTGSGTASNSPGALECRTPHRLFCVVLDDINSPVVAVAGVTVASTTGALVAMGHRAGSAGLPFASISAFVLHRTVTADAVGLVFAGLVLHMLAMFVWSFVFVWVVEHAIHREVVAAVLVAAAQFVLSGFATGASGEGTASILPLGDRIVFAGILAASLVIGIRLAFPRGQRV